MTDIREALGERGSMGDLLRMDYINSLPQPFVACLYGGNVWPVNDIDVETGLLRIDVCGKLDVKHIGDVREFIDANGQAHDADSFYADSDPPCTSCYGSGITQCERPCSCGATPDWSAI